MNKEIFLAVADRLSDQIPLAWIDFDSGQIDMMAEQPAVAFPACLIDISYPACEDTGNGEQVVTCNVPLRLVFWPQAKQASFRP